ncbi:MAG: PKD domain-containing protein [Bacteroidetes bacterium]|nr:PKD domain-containing protein [Bacteroidota bacterium]
MSEVFATINVTSKPQTNNDFCGSGGPTLTLPVVATSSCGSGTIGYKWYVGSVAPANQITSSGAASYSGWTTSTLLVNNASVLGTSTTYYAVLSETSGACADIDTIGPFNFTKVSTTPTVNIGSSPKEVCQNSTASYTVSITAPSPTGSVNYNWYRAPYSGAFSNVKNTSTSSTSDNYSYLATALRDQDRVYVTVTNTCGSTNSDTITLDVNPSPIVTVPPSMSTLSMCQGDSVQVTYSIDTAHYQNRAGNIAWTIHRSGSSALVALLDTTGVGNTTVTKWIKGLAPGVYTVTFGSITNTTEGCTRVISTNAINITVYPRPMITFSGVTPHNYCTGTDTTSFKITVSNATYNNGASTVNVNWSASILQQSVNINGNCTSGNANILTSGTLTGSGNGTFYYYPSTNLSPGTYTYKLTGITNTSNGCVGSTTGTDSIGWSVRPRPTLTVAPSSTSVCEGTSTNFNINVQNARYCVGNTPTNADWSFSFVDSTMSTIGASPLVGSGNGVVGPFTTKDTLPEGTYVFTPGTITNTTVGHGACARTITGNTFTLTINPTPHVTFDMDSIHQCQGTAGTQFHMTVSNASLNGVGQNWSVNYTGTGASALSSTACAAGTPAGIITGGQTGTGNLTKTFTVPTGLSPGVYFYQLNFITNTSSGCLTSPSSASVGAHDSITIIIDPAPVITMNPDIKEVCENDPETFNLQITNTKGCNNIGSAYNADWTLQGLTDNVQSDLATMPWYPDSTGNAIIKVNVNTALTLSPDDHSLISSVYNTTAGSVCGISNKTTDTFILSVDPRPELKINNNGSATVTMNICEGTQDSFYFAVSNAKQNGNPINWEITYSESSGNLNTSCNNTTGANQDLPGAAGAYTGLGDTSMYIQIPSSLPVGRYTYTVSNIVNTDGPCTGTINGVTLGNQTIVINVYPKPELTVTPSDSFVCEHSVLTNAFNINVTNAEYCSAANTKSNVSYEISYSTDDVDSDAPASPITGSGNGTHTYDADTSQSLAAGTYRFITSSITTTGLPTNCPNTQIDTFTLTVNPEPIASFSADTIHLCEETGGSVNITVSNAELNSANVNWRMIITEASGNIPVSNCGISAAANANIISDTIIGSGNKSGSQISFTIPDTLAPGRYTYTISSITNTDANCVGSATPNATLYIYVYPRPVVTVNSHAEVCENNVGTGSLSLQVTNAQYCPSTSAANVSYDIYFSDDVNSTTGGSPLNHSGNWSTSFNVNSPSTKTEGYYYFVVDSIQTTGLPVACTYPNIDSFELQVNPNPIATFANHVITICEGNSDSVGVEVTNAMLGTSDVNWKVTVAESAGNLVTSCIESNTAHANVVPDTITGSGNKSGASTLYYTVPNTLSPGVYIYVINSVQNTDKNCTGTSTPNDSVIVYVYPKIHVVVSPDSAEVCEGDVTNFGIKVTNAKYCSAINVASTNVDWQMPYTDATNSNIFPPDTLIGSGNSSFTLTANMGGFLGAGYYNFVANEVLYTTPAACNITLTDSNKFTLQVNPEPTVTFSTSNVNICQGESDSVYMIVTNAQLGSTGVNWSVKATSESGLVTTSCVTGGTTSAFLTGNGNDSVAIVFPNDLAVGVYEITLDSIYNVTPPCTGVIGATPVLTITVYPKPDVDLSADTLTICENTQETFDVAVTNAKYCASIGGSVINVGWEIQYDDFVDSDLTPSIWVGAGDSTFTGNHVNSTYSLTNGGSPFVLDIQKITNTTHSCVNTDSFPSSELTVIVNDLPVLTVDRITSDTCKYNPARIDYTVSDVDTTNGWWFSITANGSTDTVSGTGPYTGVFYTAPYVTPGIKGISFSAITNTATGCVGNTPAAGSVNILALPDVTSFDVNASTATVCSGDTTYFDFTVINSAGKNWVITYDIDGGSSKTWTGTGNGAFTRGIERQYHQDAAGADTTVTVTLLNITWSGTTPVCGNDTITDSTATILIHPRPYISLDAPSNVCVNYSTDVQYTVSGVKPAEDWEFNWYTTGPTDGPNVVDSTGSLSHYFTTAPLTPVGTSTVYVPMVTNTTTGCDSSNSTWADTMTVDPPTVPGTLSPSYTICDGDVGPFTFTLTGYTGVIQHWDSSENLGYLWFDIGNDSNNTHTVVSPHLTTNYQVVVKSGACPADTSNDVILFVHPQPNATLVSVTDSICSGSNIDVVFDVIGVPNTHSWTLDYTVKIGAGAPTSGSWTGTGSSSNIAKTLTNGGGGFGSGPVVITLTNITNNNTNCDTALTQSATTLVKTAPNGATVTGTDTLCQNSNGFITWDGTAADGYVTGWQKKVGSGSWTTISGASGDTLEFTQIQTTTQFRAIVKNAPCTGTDYSAPATVAVVASNPTADYIGFLPSNYKFCASPTATTSLTYKVLGTNGNDWTLQILEDDSLHTVTGHGDDTLTFTTTPGEMQESFDVVLVRLQITSGSVMCTKNLDNASTARVVILAQPAVTLNSVTASVCDGDTVSMSITVSNVKSTENWTLNYSINGNSKTTSGTGPGSYTVKIPYSVSGGNATQTVSLTSITNTTLKNSAGNTCTNTLSGQSMTYKVRGTTVAGTIGTSTSVCKGASGFVTQSAASSNGSTLTDWQSSTWTGSAWTSWTSLGNTSTTQAYVTLQNTTRYKAIYANSPCDTASSNVVTITVRELPYAVVSLTAGNDTICEGSTSTVTLTVSNIDNGQSFTVNYVEGSVSKTKTFTNNSTGVHTFTTGTITSTTDISLSSIATTSGVTCSNSSLNSTVTITVQEKPTGTIASYDNPLCQGQTVNYTITIGNVGSTDKWTANLTLDGNTETVTGTGTGTFSATTTNTVTSTSDNLVLVSVVNNSTQDACATTVNQTKVITVAAPTTAGTIGTSTSVCKGASGSVSQTASGNGSLTYWLTRSWNGSSWGSWSSIGNTATTQTYTNLQNTTQYRAVYTNSPCDTAGSNTVTITVKELPTATLSLSAGNDTICEGTTTTVNITVANISSGQTFRVDFTEGSTTRFKTFTHNGGSTYTFTTNALSSSTVISIDQIQTTSGVMCSNTNLNSSVTVTVNENPTATIAYADQTLCQGETVDFAVTVGSLGSSDNWTLKYNLDGTNETVTGTGTGTFSFTTTATVTATSDVLKLDLITNNSIQDACNSTLSDSKTITVDTTTVPGIVGTSAISKDTTICVGGSAQLVEYQAGTGNINKWQSKVSSSSTWVDINTTGTVMNVYNVNDTTLYRAVYQNGVCASAVSNSVAVNPKQLPLAVISTVVDDSICAGTTADFEITVTNVSAGQNFTVYYKEGSVNRQQNLTQNGSGVHTITTGTLTTSSLIQLTSINVTSGHPQCSDTLSSNATITVLDLPFATITSGPDTLCQNDKIVFTVNISNVASTDSWKLIYELESDLDTITGTGPGSFTRVDTDSNTAESAKIQLVEITNLSNLGVCKSVNTDDWDIYIYKPTEPGTIGTNDTICKGGSTAISEIVGTPKQGVTVSWEYRPESASNWTGLSNSNTTLNVINLQETTHYRAVYKSGVCDTAHSNVVTITVRELPVATLSGSTTICQGDSADLTITVSNVGSGQDWEIDFLEGTQFKTITGTGNGNHTLRVYNVQTTTDVTLREIRTVSLVPQCVNNKLSSNATATVRVNQRPYASLNGVNTPVCQGSTSSFTVSISNVKSNENWTLTYDVDDATFGATYSGKGPGTYTITTPSLNTDKTYYVKLNNILNTSTGCDSNLTSQLGIVVDATTQPGSVASDTTVCYASHVGTVRHTGGNGSIVRWETSQDNGVSWATISSTASNYTYSNLTKTSKFRVVKQNGVCSEAATSPITVTVNQLPVATVSGSDTICAGTSGTLTVTATNTQGQNWKVSYLVGTRIDTLSVSGPLTTGTINTGTLSKTTDVTLKKIWMTSGAPQCENNNLTNNATGTVEVNDLPAATLISLTDSVCTGHPAYGKATVSNVRSYEKWKLYWSINGGAADSATGTGAGSFNFTTKNLTVNPSTLRLTKIVNSSTGCNYLPTDQDSVIVSPVTVGGTLSSADTVCKGSNNGTLVLGADARGSILKWEYSTDNGSTWSTINNTASSYTYNNISTSTWYRVLVKNGACDAAYSSTVKITVNELPVAAITSVGANSICEGSSTYVVLTLSNVGSGQNWELKYLQGSSVKTLSGTGPGKDTIFTGTLIATTDITLQTLKITSGSPRCENLNITNNYTTTINVIDNPTATITNYPSNICKGETPSVTVLVDDVKSSQSWTLIYRVNNGSNRTTSGVGSGSFSLNNMPSLTKEGPNGIRLMSITNTSTSPNCTGALSDSITIMVDSTSVGGTIAGVSKVCKGSSAALLLNGERGSVQKWQYSTDGINYYDIANTSDSLNTAALNVKTWFRAVVQNGVCAPANSSVKIVDVQELPTVSINNPTQTICSGSTVTLNLSIGNVSSSDTWTLTYKENGTASTYSSGTGTSESITFGPYTQTTTIEITGITLKTGLGCSNTISEKAVITVTPNPTATITSVPDSLCEDDVLSFYVTVDDVATGTQWALDYEIDGVAATTKKGTGSGTFVVNTARKVSPSSVKIELKSIKLDNTLGCASTLKDTRTIMVSPKTVGGSLSPASTLICSGASTNITLSGHTGRIVRWEYSTDNGATWTATANTDKTLQPKNLTQTTQYRVFVQSGSCNGAYSSVATVTIKPAPEATVTSNDVVCPGEDAVFTVHVTNVGAGENWSLRYRKDGGGFRIVTGTGSGDFTFNVVGSSYAGNPTYITVDLYDITNTTFGCTNADLNSSATARVTPKPVVDFTVSDNCQDSMFHFNNLSSIKEGNITNYKWYFGDGDSSIDISPDHMYGAPATYTVTLKATSENGCSSSATKDVKVYPLPVALFDANNVCQNAAFSATDRSSISSGSIASRFWTFGDGSTSTVKNPTHTYATSGNFDVTLTVVSTNGCSATYTKTITVYLLPEANFVANPVCEGLAMNFTNSSAIGYGSMTYQWNFAGQGTSQAKDPNFTFNGYGTFGVRMIAVSNNGCKDTIDRNVTVYPSPTALFTVSSVCIGDPSAFKDASTVPSGTITEHYWNFGDQNFSGLTNPMHTYAAPGTYNVTLRVKSNNGCEDTYTNTADVIDLPKVDLKANGPTEFCQGKNVVLSANPSARDYQWTWDGGSATTSSITVTKSGWYKVRITSAPLGCANEDSIYVTVWPLPTAKAWPRDKVTQSIDTVSKGQSIDLHASGGEVYDWNPGTYLSSTVSPDVIARRVETDITYTVTVTDSNGCRNSANVSVVVLDDFELVVYNTVTPNGDGLNDTWYIENIWAYPDAEVIVFNRYGMQVYRNTGYKNTWAGTYQKTGEDLPDGPYYYVITHPDFKDKVYKGVINIIREKK